MLSTTANDVYKRNVKLKAKSTDGQCISRVFSVSAVPLSNVQRIAPKDEFRNKSKLVKKLLEMCISDAHEVPLSDARRIASKDKLRN